MKAQDLLNLIGYSTRSKNGFVLPPKTIKKERKSLKVAMRDCKTLFTQSSRTFVSALDILENRCAGVLYKTPFPKF